MQIRHKRKKSPCVIGRDILKRYVMATLRVLVIGGCAAVFTVARSAQFDEGPILNSDAAGELQWEFLYDDAGRIKQMVGPDRKRINIHYETDKKGFVHRVNKEMPQGRVTNEYDRFGRRIAMADMLGETRYEYDGFNRLIAVRRVGNPALSYTYDTLDRLSSVSVGNAFTVRYRYDFMGRLEAMETPVGAVLYQYLPGQGRIVST